MSRVTSQGVQGGVAPAAGQNGSVARRVSRVAAVRVRGGTAFGVSVQAQGLSVRVLEAASVPAGEIEKLVARLGGEQTVVVLAPECAVVRPVSAGVQLAGGAEQVGAALGLVAESQLPETMPAHRRSAGVLRHGAARSVAAIGWTGDAGVRSPGAAYVPAPVALLGAVRVLMPQGGVLIEGDAATGLMTIAACRSSNEGPVVVRVVRDEPGSGEAWARAVEAVGLETGEMIGSEVRLRMLGTLAVSDEPAEMAGLGAGRLSDYAACLGAAVFALQAQADERPLLAMMPDAPVVRRAPALGLAERFGTPGRLGAVAAASCVLLLGGYVGAEHLRLWSLERRAGEAASDQAAFRKAVEQQQLLTLVRDRRWPLTLLAAQLTASMPEGVLIEGLSLDHGRPIVITGIAPNAEAVNQWRAALVADRTLSDVAVPQQTPVSEGATAVRFTINAKVADALAGVKAGSVSPAPATRRREETPATTDRVSAAAPAGDTRPTATPAAPAERRTRRGETPAAPASPTPATSATANRSEPPAALSEAQLAKLTLAQARVEWARRRGWSQNETIDDAARARLTTEVEQLQRRMDELKNAGGGGQ